MQPQREIGTIEWFRAQRAEIVLLARAVDDLKTSGSAAGSLVELWEDEGSAAGLETHLCLATVVAYARPFCRSRTAQGSTRNFPMRVLTDNADFDRNLHRELLHLRDKYFAHSDNHAYPPDLIIHQFNFPVRGSQVSIPGLAHARSFSVLGFANISMAKRVSAHVTRVCASCSHALQARLRAYISAAADHPDTCRDSHVGGRSVSSGPTNLEKDIPRHLDLKNMDEQLMEVPIRIDTGTYILRTSSFRVALDKYVYDPGEGEPFTVRFRADGPHADLPFHATLGGKRPPVRKIGLFGRIFAWLAGPTWADQIDDD